MIRVPPKTFENIACESARETTIVRPCAGAGKSTLLRSRLLLCSGCSREKFGHCYDFEKKILNVFIRSIRVRLLYVYRRCCEHTVRVQMCNSSSLLSNKEDVALFPPPPETGDPGVSRFGQIYTDARNRDHLMKI